MNAVSILWQRLDQPGLESARLTQANAGWLLEGTTLLQHDDRPCRLCYRIQCDEHWRTREARVHGWIGARSVDLAFSVDAALKWRLNGQPCPAVAGCVDLDLNFSPSTNLLPIRRLDLNVGGEAAVRAAWLRFPGLGLEPLEQVYRRIEPSKYIYRSAGGSFTAEVEVTREGLVVRYGDIWSASAVGR